MSGKGSFSWRNKHRNMEDFHKTEVEESDDLLKELDHDSFLHILSFLESGIDVAHASMVSHSWRKHVMESQIFKRLCIKYFPEIESCECVSEKYPMNEDTASSSIYQSPYNRLRSEHHFFQQLLYDIESSSGQTQSCIFEALFASSTDNYPQESIINTLFPHPERYALASYWSSKGHKDADVPEILTYRLATPLCMVEEFNVRPFQAFFQPGKPVYSSKFVRIRLGQEIHPSQEEDSKQPKAQNKEGYLWTYVSPKFLMEQSDTLQTFRLPRPVLCIGGIVQVEFLGRIQTQQTDQLYYICICHVNIQGRPFSGYETKIENGNIVVRHTKFVKGSRFKVQKTVPQEERDLYAWHALVDRFLYGAENGVNLDLFENDSDDDDEEEEVALPW